MAVMTIRNLDDALKPRMRAIGKTAAGHYVFAVFMVRNIDGQTRLRPISARYMHPKEIDHDEHPKRQAAFIAQERC